MRRPNVEEWLLLRVLPEDPAATFSMHTVTTQLGWTEEEVWRVRARIIERERQENASRSHGGGSGRDAGSKTGAGRERATQDETGTAAPVVEIFVAYARADEARRERLDKHLSALRRSKDIEDWSDQLILPGEEWPKAVRERLDRADIVLLLVSADFMHSDYCYGVEMRRALERHDAGEAVVIPVILCPCDWKGTPLAKLQALPRDAKPISRWDDEDEAFLDVVESIRRVVQDRKKRSASEETSKPRRAGKSPRA